MSNKPSIDTSRKPSSGLKICGALSDSAIESANSNTNFTANKIAIFFIFNLLCSITNSGYVWSAVAWILRRLALRGTLPSFTSIFKQLVPTAHIFQMKYICANIKWYDLSKKLGLFSLDFEIQHLTTILVWNFQ